MKTVLILKVTAGGECPVEAFPTSASGDLVAQMIDLSQEPWDEAAVVQAVFAADAAHVW